MCSPVMRDLEKGVSVQFSNPITLQNCIETISLHPSWKISAKSSIISMNFDLVDHDLEAIKLRFKVFLILIRYFLEDTAVFIK